MNKIWLKAAFHYLSFFICDTKTFRQVSLKPFVFCSERKQQSFIQKQAFNVHFNLYFQTEIASFDLNIKHSKQRERKQQQQKKNDLIRNLHVFWKLIEN